MFIFLFSMPVSINQIINIRINAAVLELAKIWEHRFVFCGKSQARDCCFQHAHP